MVKWWLREGQKRAIGKKIALIVNLLPICVGEGPYAKTGIFFANFVGK
jgi:hypothetical protein